MSTVVLAPRVAGGIYDLLVESAGAADSARADFVDHASRVGIDEWRFCGSLGFGGKLYVERDRWRVACYPEDRSTERDAAVEVTNAALDRFRRSVSG